LLVLLVVSLSCAYAQDAGKDNPPKDAAKDDAKTATPIIPKDSTTQGSVSVAGHTINYQAVAGTILVAATNDADAALGTTAQPPKETPDAPPTARIFYVAYFKKDVPADSRPVTFIYNGGPGSSTIWLHMGAFGPRRIITSDDQHTSPAPYELVDNAYSLLDASDLVFIDAPGTPLPASSPVFSPTTNVGTRPNIFSEKATAPPARRWWPVFWRRKATSTSTASSCFRKS
jgi:carboxypeptidase C (cathepsin A)